jgi:hypothetical protein
VANVSSGLFGASRIVEVNGCERGFSLDFVAYFRVNGQAYPQVDSGIEPRSTRA